MSIETSAIGTLIIILVMAGVTLATRWGGIFVMSFVPIGRRVQQFIGAMSGSVLVALLAPLAVNGDGGARLALLATAATMLLLKQPLPAIAAGIATAALSRQLL
ncbi:AzlD family protein [Thauera butanivorans]|uniref:AzlD family protein n=1 Tax=Thauera butanivorans TaxID=86174 RepID=UPI0008382666|nr:AzlD domain-containing protein [Thauera butanivorans]